MTSTDRQIAMESLKRKVALRIVPILFLVQLLGIVDRFNVGFAKIQMGQSLGLSESAYGLGAGLFFIGYFLFEIPSNMILAKVGARIWFTRILLTWGLATMAMAFVQDVKWFYILRFIIGAAEAGFAPGVQLYFSAWFAHSYRNRVNAWFLMSIPFAGLISAPLSGYVLGTLSLHAGLLGWQWLFLLEGAVTVLLAPVLLLLLPSNPGTATWLTPEERSHIASVVTQSAQTAPVHSVAALFRNRQLLIATLVYFLLMQVNYSVSFWMPQIITTSGITNPRTVGWLAAIPSACALVFMPIISALADKGNGRNYIALGSLLGGVGLIVTSLYTSSTYAALSGLTIATVGVLTTIPVFWAYIARICSQKGAVIGFAAVNSIGNLAGFVAPYFIGLIAGRTGSPAIATGIIALGASISAILAIRRLGNTG